MHQVVLHGMLLERVHEKNAAEGSGSYGELPSDSCSYQQFLGPRESGLRTAELCDDRASGQASERPLLASQSQRFGVIQLAGRCVSEKHQCCLHNNRFCGRMAAVELGRHLQGAKEGRLQSRLEFDV